MYERISCPITIAAPIKLHPTCTKHACSGFLDIKLPFLFRLDPSRTPSFGSTRQIYTNPQQSNGLVDLEELDLELESRVGWDDRREATGTVGVIWSADEVRLLPDGELRNTLVPAFDHSTHADLGDEWRSPISGRVELGSIKERPNVVDADRVAFLGVRLAVPGGDTLNSDTHFNSCSGEGTCM